MNKIILISIFTYLLINSLFALKEDKKASTPPRFDLDLNMDPEHRWDHIVPVYKEQIQNFVSQVIDPLDIKKSTLVKVGIYFNNVYKYQDMVKEIQGIARVVEVEWQKIMLANFLYELSTFPSCSSILVKNMQNTIMHGRNLDFPYQGMLSRLVAIVDVYRGNNYVATFDQIVSGVIVLTGQNDRYSITEDTRTYFDGEMMDILKFSFVDQFIPSTWLLRQVLQENFSYEEASDTLLYTNTTSPIYYTIGGIDNQGMVIAKKPIGYFEKQDISDPSIWYIVQTNYDKGKDPESDDRKTPATLRLNAIGQQNIDADNFYNILTERPTFNDHTIYSVLLSSDLQYNKISLWYGNVFDGIYDQEDEREFDQNEKKQDFKIDVLNDERFSKFRKFIGIIDKQDFFGDILQNLYGIQDLDEKIIYE